ncbi:tRNA pseudouridine(38-40) synthase TruA [Paracoccus sp. S-4012]|uniref:tRNA pseudouridine(38-40) synthase TruA n=1 Tax=Paracoccus sp. S-4012 TaxID=2665648 RepID=UPI0012AFD9D3|nr:tRNA pseudouridine(38-40) synthase TruA [Paracoccus sp. S-4012]MRX49432.1 tRNA pseudouridine(38-40) synthase TruA [Paracoccus sp. S-4012]
MPRYALKIEYDGRPFAGWQAQAGLPSVQGAVERALAALDPGFAAGARIAAAGRTDAGVHATGQVAHADMARDWAPDRLRDAVNAHLRPDPVAVLAIARVPDDWHARFSAVERRYLFRLLSRRAPAVLDAGRVWQVRHALDLDAMREGAAHLVGRHDFTTFRSTMCQSKTPVKTLDEIAIDAVPVPHGTEFRLALRARSFLHNQVRSIVGTLERVGAGAWPPARVAEALAARDRAACGPVCPPQGLCLTGVGYPADPFSAGGASGLHDGGGRPSPRCGR